MCKMAESRMAEFKMAAIIKLNENEWVNFFCANSKEGSVSEVFFVCKWWEPILESVSDFERKNYDGWFQDVQIQDGRIKDGYHHQVESEWMSEVFLCKW